MKIPWKRIIWFSALFAVLLYSAVRAEVDEGQVVQGQATFQQQGTTTVIHADHNTIIEYGQFNIAAAETVQFIQPGATARVLNRVLGPDPSRIDGTLLANGIVYLVNPAGVFFGQGALVDAAKFYAAAGTLTNADFLNSIDRFQALTGTVSNLGTLRADRVGLVGSRVINGGSILAPEGMIALAAGRDVLLSERDGHLMVKVQAEALGGSGLDLDIQTTGDPDPHRSGHTPVVLVSGDIYGMAIHQGEQQGLVVAGGLLDVSGNSPGAQGGSIALTGERVAVTGRLDASGHSGGGTIRVGGDYQGQGLLSAAQQTVVMPGAELVADAVAQGDGGRVIVWSDGSTRYFGSLSAQGGALSGQGGFAEVSGKGVLDFHGAADLSAEAGAPGTLLLDPLNIEISTNPDANTAGFNPPGDLTEAFADDGGLDSVFDVTAGTGSFNGVGNGTTIELQATNDINVLNDFNIATSTGNSDVSLVLRGGNDINVQAVITASGTGTLSLSADDNTPDGAGEINLSAAGGLVTANQAITLESNDIDINAAASINAGSGTVTLLASDGGTVGVGDTAGGYTLSGAEMQRITAGNLAIGDNSNGTLTVDNISAANSNNISGTVTLNATQAGSSVNFANNASTFNALTVNAGTGGVGAGQALTTDTGALLIDGGTGTVDLDGDLTAATTLTLQNAAEVDLAGDVDLLAQAGNVVADTGVTLIDLSGGGGTSNVITATGGTVDLGAVSDSGTPDELEINADNAVTLTSVNIANLLDVDLDENAGGASLTTGALSAGTITVDGTGTDDTLTFNSTVISNTAGVTLNQANVVDLNGDVTAATALTLSNVNTEVDLAGDVDLLAQAGNLSANTGVTGIDLSGGGGTSNIITATGGAVNLGAVADTGTPDELEINADNAVTLTSVNIANLLDVDVDENAGGASLTAGALSAGTITVDGTGTDDTLTFNSTVISNTAGVTLNQANVVDLNGDVTAATALTLSNVNTEVDLAGDVDLLAQAGNLSANTGVTGIDLSGGGGTSNIITATGGAVNLGAVADTGIPDELEINADNAVTLTSVNIANLLDVDVDENAGGASLTAGALSAGTITVDGTGTDDTLTFNSTVTSNTGSVTLNQANVVDLNGDVTGATALTITNVNTEVDLAGDVDLAAQAGNLSANTVVTSIDLSGGGGTSNTLTATGGAVNLGAVTDSGTPDELAINSEQGVTIASADLAGQLTINADSDGSGNGDLNVGAGGLTTANQAISLDSNDLDINAFGSIDAGSGTVTLLVSDGGTVGVGATAGAYTLSGAELQSITAGNLVIGDNTNGSITVDNISAANSNNISGTVTLNATQGGAGVNFANNPSTFNALTVNAGTGGVSVAQALSTDTGALLIEGGTGGLDADGDLTAATTLTLQNTGAIDLAGNVDLTAQAGDLALATGVTGINLSGAGGTVNRLTATGGAVQAAAISDTGTPAELEINAGNGITLTSVNIANLLDVDLDENGGGAVLTTGLLNAGTLTVDGTGTDDTFTFNSTVTSNTGGVSFNQANVVDLNGDVTGATSLTITNVNTELDLAGNVDLIAQGGALSASTGITGIDLSGAGGTRNVITATGGAVDLGAVTDSGTPDELEINSQQSVTLASANLAGQLTINADSDANGSGDISVGAGGLTTANQAISLDSSDLILNPAATLNAGAGTVTLLVSDGGTVGVGATAGAYTLSSAELQRITAGNLVIGDNTNGSITVDNISAANSNNISGTVTLNATQGGAGVNFANNPSTFNALTVNAGTGGVSVAQALSTDTGALLIEGGTGGLDVDGDLTGATTLTLQNTGAIDLAGNVDLTAQAGDLALATGVTGINLSGAGGTVNRLTATGGAVQAATISDTGTPDELEINAGNGVTLTSVDIANLLDVDLDENGGGATLTTGLLNAGTLTVDGTGSDDTFTFNSTVTSNTGGVSFNQANVVDLNGDVTGATSLTIANVNTEVDLAGGVDLIAQGGALSGGTGVAGIDLSGGGGTRNVITATGGSVTLGAVSNSGTPDELEVNSDQNVTLPSANLAGQLTLNADSDSNGSGDISVGAGGLTTANQTISLSSSDLTLNPAATLDAGSATVNLLVSDGGTFGLGATGGNYSLTGAELQRITAGNLVIGDNSNGSITVDSISAANSNNISGTVTLNATQAGEGVNFANNASTFNALTVNAGTGGVSVGQALSTDTGALLINGGTGTVDLDGDLTAATTLTLQNAAEVDLAGDVDLTAQAGNLSVNTGVTAIDLSGAGGTRNILTATGGAVTLSAVADTGTPDELEINADNAVTLTSVDMANLLDVDLDENGGGAALTTGVLNAGTITVDGTGNDDTLTFNSTVTSNTGGITLNQANGVDLNGDVTGATALTITNVNTEVDLAGDVDLTAQAGNLSATTGVTSIDLSGAGGTSNIITATSGAVNLGAVSDTGTPDELEINADNAVTLTSVNIANLLDVDLDENAGGASLTTGVLSAGTITVDGTGADDTLTFNSTVTGNTGGVTLNQADVVDLNGDVTAATNLTISNVNTEVDLAGDVDLTAQADNVVVSAGVTLIDLSGGGGTSNIITATSGTVNLGAVSDSGTPDELEINSDDGIGLISVDMANLLDLDVDENGGGSFLNAGALSAGTITVDGTGADDSFIFTGPVTSNTGGVTLNQADVVDLNGDVTAATSLTISNVNTEVDLAGDVDLTAQADNVVVSAGVTLIDLSGGGGTSNIITATSGTVNLGAVSDSGTPDELEINSDDGIGLISVDMANLLDLDVDENGGGSFLNAGPLSAGTITADGTGADDTFIFTGPVTSNTGGVTLNQANVVDLNGDVTAATALTISNVNTEVDLAGDVDLLAQAGNLSATTGVTSIDLSGGGGTSNIITATGGAVNLGAVADTGTPDELEINADNGITLTSANIANLLDVDLDENGGGATLTAGTLSAGTITVNGTGADDTMTFGSTVSSTAGSINIADAQQIDAGGSITSSGALTITGTSITLGDASSSGNQHLTGAATLDGAYQTGGGDFTLTGPTTLAGDTTVTTQGGDSLFTGAINADAAANNRTLAVNGSSGEVSFAGDIGTTQALAGLTSNTQGHTVFSATTSEQCVKATDVQLGADLATVPSVATIYRDQLGDLDFDVNTLSMGVNQKMTVLGSLDIDNDTVNSALVTVGDLTALQNIAIDANGIVFTRRDAGHVLNYLGSLNPDLGVDLVAGGSISFSSSPMATGSGASPRLADQDGQVTNAGGFVVQRLPETLSEVKLTGPGGQVLDFRPDGASSGNTAGTLYLASMNRAEGLDPRAEEITEDEGKIEGESFEEFMEITAGRVRYQNLSPDNQSALSLEALARILKYYRSLFYGIRWVEHLDFESRSMLFRKGLERLRRAFIEKDSTVPEDPCFPRLWNILQLIDAAGFSPIQRAKAGNLLLRPILPPGISVEEARKTLFMGIPAGP